MLSKYYFDRVCQKALEKICDKHRTVGLKISVQKSFHKLIEIFD